MRAGQYRDSRGNVYRNREVAMRYLGARIDASLGVRLRALAESRVLVGLPDGSDPYPDGTSVIDVAFKNEFGDDNVPERPFLRTTVRKNLTKYYQRIESDLPAVIEGRLPAVSLWHRVGMVMQSDVQNAVQEWSTPPNARSTQIAKGRKASPEDVAEYMRTAAREPEHDGQNQKIGLSIGNDGEVMINNPLVDTGHLTQAIRYVVESVNES